MVRQAGLSTEENKICLNFCGELLKSLPSSVWRWDYFVVLIYRHVPSDLLFRCLDYYISWNLFVLHVLGGGNVWTLSQLNILQMHPVRMFWWIWKAEEEKALTTWRTLIQETSFWAFVKKIGLALGQCFFILSLALFFYFIFGNVDYAANEARCGRFGWGSMQ